MVFHNFRLSNLMECSFIELIPCILMMIHSILKLFFYYFTLFLRSISKQMRKGNRVKASISAHSEMGVYVIEWRGEWTRKFSDNMAVFNAVCPLEKSIWKCTLPLQLIHLSQKTTTHICTMLEIVVIVVCKMTQCTEMKVYKSFPLHLVVDDSRRCIERNGNSSYYLSSSWKGIHVTDKVQP